MEANRRILNLAVFLEQSWVFLQLNFNLTKASEWRFYCVNNELDLGLNVHDNDFSINMFTLFSIVMTSQSGRSYRRVILIWSYKEWVGQSSIFYLLESEKKANMFHIFNSCSVIL